MNFNYKIELKKKKKTKHVKLRQMQGELKQSAWLIIPEIIWNAN